MDPLLVARARQRIELHRSRLDFYFAGTGKLRPRDAEAARDELEAVADALTLYFTAGKVAAETGDSEAAALSEQGKAKLVSLLDAANLETCES